MTGDYWIELCRSGGAAVRYNFVDDVLCLGSGEAPVDVRVPELGASRLVLTRTALACGVSLSGDVEIRHRGEILKAESVPWGEEFYLDGVRIGACRAEASGAQSKARLVVLLSALLFAILSFRAQSGAPQVVEVATEWVSEDALFVAQRCECEGVPACERRAQEYEGDAVARSERYAFDPRDGSAAARLFARAVSCRQQAGDEDQALRLEAMAADWQRRVAHDLRGHELALKLAKKNEQPERVVAELQALGRFLPHDSMASENIRKHVRRLQSRQP